jgi:hypothetical protein
MTYTIDKILFNIDSFRFGSRKTQSCERGAYFGQSIQNSLDYYEKSMTELYSKYPDDRDLPFSLLLDKLSDSDHMSIEEIHRWLATMNSKRSEIR